MLNYLQLNNCPGSLSIDDKYKQHNIYDKYNLDETFIVDINENLDAGRVMILKLMYHKI